MPAQSNLTLNTKVYTPRGTSNGVSSWVLANDTTFGGAPSTVTESVRGPLEAGLSKVRWVVAIPKVATVDSACSCIGASLGLGKADVNITVPASFTLAERQDFVDRIQDLVALIVFYKSVADLEGSWS